MTLDLRQLRDAVERHGPVVRVVVASVEGSAPARGRGGNAGLGGWATRHHRRRHAGIAGRREGARGWLDGRRCVQRAPLGPALGQCCGGAVTLVYERFDAAMLASIDTDAADYVRRVSGDGPCPTGLTALQLTQGWLSESIRPHTTPIWIYGRRTRGSRIGKCPERRCRITRSRWVDTGPDRFEGAPDGADHLWAEDLSRLVAQSPENAQHFVMTYSHAFDLGLCHALLNHRFACAGLIGSRTKWARFRSRARATGPPGHRNRPHRLPHRRPDALAAHPQAIAVERGHGYPAPRKPPRRRPDGAGGMSDARAPLLTLKGLTKAYPGVVANSDVSFRLARARSTRLLGENGAGKSTLVKMIYGLVRPDSGSWRCVAAAMNRPHPMRPAAGVAMVFQHFSLFDALDVAENIALGMENPPKQRALAARIPRFREAYGLPLDPSRLVGDLSAGRAPAGRDHPLPAAGPQAADHGRTHQRSDPARGRDPVSRPCAKLSAEGTAILYISHKLEEIRSLCDGHDPAIGKGGGRM